jgi:predicted DNA-binding transcriptional regulator AlpA
MSSLTGWRCSLCKAAVKTCPCTARNSLWRRFLACGRDELQGGAEQRLAPAGLYLILTIDNSTIPRMRQILVGAKEVADLLGVSRQRVNKIAQTHSEFPAPLGILAGGRIWSQRDILQWARRTGRSLESSTQLE